MRIPMGVDGLEPPTSSLSSLRFSKSRHFLLRRHDLNLAYEANRVRRGELDAISTWPSLAGIGNGFVRATFGVSA